MQFRTIVSGTVAVMLLTGPTFAAEHGGLFGIFKSGGTLSAPKLFGSKEEPKVQLVQAGDPRISALEEQVRALSGTIEELNFQILQMQEQLRKQQEDNEFRFQELEGAGKPKKKSDAGAPADTSIAKTDAQQAPVDAATPPAQPSSIEEVIVDDGSGNPGKTTTGAPKEFGTITFDSNGNVTGGGVGDQASSGTASPVAVPANPPADGTIVAALPSTDNPEELYRDSYEFILSGDYSTAEAGFRDHVNRFPNDKKTADARFWLGEALLGQKKYRDAAETFLAANKEFPSATKAPDMLLKLGVSLVGLDQRDVACATYAEIGKRYPSISGVLKERVKQEQALASC